MKAAKKQQGRQNAEELSRAGLMRFLGLVDPALSSNRIIPALSHYWFTGTHLMAHDDRLAIRVPFETTFRGAFGGETLLRLLQTGDEKRHDTVLLYQSDDGKNAVLEFGKAGKSIYTFALLPPSEFESLFTMPDHEEPLWLQGDICHEIVQAIDFCNKSLGADTDAPETTGVTVMPNGKGIDVYATNNYTMARWHIGLGDKVDFKPCILPARFCRELVKLDHKEPSIEFFDDHAMYAGDDGYTMFTRLVESSGRVDYPKMFNSHLPKTNLKPIPVPDRLLGILRRSVILRNEETDPIKTELSIKDGRASIFMQTSVSSQQELDIPVGELADIPVIKFDSALFLNNFVTHIFVTDRCVVLSDHDGRGTYLLAVRAG